MSVEILKMLVESACSDGSITDSDKALLQKKASDFGISQAKLDEMIAEALGAGKNTPPTSSQNDNSGSGFITDSSVAQSENEKKSGSGFITSSTQVTPPPPPPQPNESSFTNSGAEFAAKFTDVSELSAQGAMSTVYQGKQYGKWIIIKRIKEQFRNNQDYKNLFFKEFENSYHLDHPNITRILDKGEDELGAYYTMEYVDGRPLSKMIASENLKSNEKLITRIFSQIIDALNYVHKKQIIHRDLKPDNILVTYRGDNVKILDFGLAAADSFDDNLLKVGTPKYAAPEQMVNGSKVDQRADIYALGLILLEMATGSLDDKTAQTVENPNFKEIIQKSTKQNPDERYADCQEILDVLKRKVLGLENKFTQNEVTQTESAFTGIEDIIASAVEKVDIGVPIQGEIINEVISGARLGTLIVRSASSGTGKTRQAVGDACLIAYPFRYEPTHNKWEQTGSGRKVIFIATEQTIPEIQKMILAYLTGFNESKFRYGNFTEKENRIIRQAVWIMEQYKDNFYIVQMPAPRIDLVKNLVREQVLLHGIEYVFFDYVFICPSLLGEFKGINLRNDEVLLLFSTALKELAVELNVCVFTSTQVNANIDSNTTIRNESSIAGSRAIINKADIGMVMARPTKEEIDFFASMGQAIPTIVTDVYKVRSGEWSQVRIWSIVDLGCLRKVDLFLTDSRLEIISDYEKHFLYEIDWENTNYQEILEKVNNLK